MGSSIDANLQRPFRVGAWNADPETGRLIRDGAVMNLEPNEMAVLRCLVKNPGTAVSWEELAALVWPGMSVDHGVISASVLKLKHALQDGTPETGYIEILSSNAYRVVAEVEHGIQFQDKPGSAQGAAHSVSSQKTSDANKESPLMMYAGVIIPIVFLLGLIIHAYTTDVDQPQGRDNAATSDQVSRETE